MNDAFSKIRAMSNGGEVKVAAAIYNVGGKFVRKPFMQLTLEEFEAGFEANGWVWRTCLVGKESVWWKARRGAFLFAQHCIPLLLAAKDEQHPPTLIYTGATAAIRGSAQMSSFATGKFAMRALAQSLAREFGPQGIHVAHAIIDG
jgi:NAD(P)-dependent dehydrogenase (short-subunit alcohol dehydrogenase family)